MSELGFHGWADIALAAAVAFLFMLQVILFFIVGALIIGPLWLVSLFHYLTAKPAALLPNISSQTK